MTVTTLARFRRGLNVRSFVVNWLSLKRNMGSSLEFNFGYQLDRCLAKLVLNGIPP